VTEAREGNFFVFDDKPVSKDGKACECQYYTNVGIPCSHMISVLRHNNSALTIDLFDPHWRLRSEDLLSIQNQSLEDDATVNDDDARSERTKNTKELKSERRHDLNELCKEFMELGAEEEHIFAFAKELLEDTKTRLERFKVELLGRVQSKLKKQNKIIYSQPGSKIGPSEFQSPVKKGGNHTGGKLGKGRGLKRGRGG